MFILGSLKCVTAKAPRAKIDRKSAISLKRGQFDPKFQVAGVAPTNHSSSHKTRLNDHSYGIENQDRSLFHFVTIHAFDRQTDGRTDGWTEFL